MNGPSGRSAGNATVEAWRGLAALLVLACHWLPAVGIQHAWVAFTFTGVDVFFVLSGFVFAPICLGLNNPALAGYALRRVMRIYPAYLAALGIYVALALAQGRPTLYLGEHLVMAHVQTREMAFYYSPPFWSLPAEVEFYALLPLLGWGLGKLGRPWGLPALLMAALAVRVVLLALADGEAENSAYINLHHLPGLLVEFLLGVWAWQLHGRSWTLGKRWAWALSGGSGILVCGVFFHQAQTGPGGPHWSHGQMGLGVAASFALILAATSGLEVKKDGVRRVCDWAGRLSYGTYLLHSAWAMAITGWAAQWGAVAGLSAGAAGLAVSVLALHLTVEEPLRRWGRRMADRLDQKTSVSPG